MNLAKEKKCECCGMKYTLVPEGSVLLEGMYWFNCKCDSTLVIDESDVL